MMVCKDQNSLPPSLILQMILMFWLVRSLLMLILAPNVVAPEVACTGNLNLLEVANAMPWKVLIVFGFSNYENGKISMEETKLKVEKDSLVETLFNPKPSFLSFFDWIKGKANSFLTAKQNAATLLLVANVRRDLDVDFPLVLQHFEEV